MQIPEPSKAGSELSSREPVYRVEATEQGTRIDVYLAGIMSDRASRSQIKKMIESGHITVDGNEVPAHFKVKENNRIRVNWPHVDNSGTKAEEIPLNIVHEDEFLVVVNKAPGMVVHPAHGNLEGTLVNALLYHFQELSDFRNQDPVRPGIVHRLDKDTSGIMVIAKNEKVHASLAKQFKNHTIERVYNTVVKGVVQHDEGLCEEPVGRAFLNRKKVIIRPSGGKNATTFYRVLKRFETASLLEVRPRTGRTHQIRVHMNHEGHPVLGDLLYGVASPWIKRQALHAKSLGFTHPGTKKRVFYDSQLPEDFTSLLAHLEAGS